MIKITAVIMVMISLGFASCSIERNSLRKVQSGELQLICNDKIIDPVRVTDYIDGRWYFDNGSMTNCEIRDKA